MNKAVLFLIFNRMDTTQKVFEQIKLARPPRLYIASDGARVDKINEEKTVEKIRRWVLENIDWQCEVKTLFRDTNLGCGKGVASSISWFFEQEEDGIILEDDCVPSQSFFTFCEELLDYYKENKRIWMISGDQFIPNYKGEASYYFTKIPGTWGWATWADRWAQYKFDLNNYDKKYIKNFSNKKEVQKYWVNILNKMKTGKIEAWDYQLTFEIVKNNGLCINPSVNLISNIGIDGTHFIDDKKNPLLNIPTYECEKIKHPAKIDFDYESVDWIYKNVFCIKKNTIYKIIKSSCKKAFSIAKKLFKRPSDKNNYLKLFDSLSTKPRFIEKTIEFEGRKITIPDSVSFAYQIKDIFIEEEYKFKAETDEPLIIDCGANVGTSILYFKKIYPNAKIKAIEADEKIFNILEKNIEGLKNIELYQNAAWVNNNDLFFDSDGADGGRICLDEKPKNMVKGIRLKDFIEKEKKIDFLKLDIEGAEVEVIKDCEKSLKNIKNIFIEYHSFSNNTQRLGEILKILSKNGFRYNLNNLAPRKSAFMNKGEHLKMDLQVNIYGYRNFNN